MTVLHAPGETRLYTAEELMDLPPEAHFELMDGRLMPMSPTGEGHGYVTVSLTSRIVVFVEDNDLGRCTGAETGFLLARNPDVVLAPDFAFTAKARLTGPPRRGFAVVVPDLVWETRSPGDHPAAVAQKVARWLSYGATVVIDAHPETQTLTLHRKGEERVTLGTPDTFTLPDLFPGFSAPLSRVF